MLKVPSINLTSVATGVLSIGTLLSLVLLIPATQNFIDDTKLYITFAVAIVLGVLFSVAIVRRGGLELVLSRINYAVAGFLLATSASTFFTNAYPVKALLSFGGVFLATSLIVFFAAPLLSNESKKTWFNFFNVGMVAVVLGSLLELAGVGPSKLIASLGLTGNAALLFNLSGSLVYAFQLAIMGAVGIGFTWFTTKKATPFQVVTMVAMLVGIGLYGYHMLPGRNMVQLPNLSASWSVALDSVREPRSALIGVGTGSYVAAYQQYKPVWLQDASVFATATNTPLTILTTSGFLGLIAWVLLVFFTVKEFKKSDKDDRPVGAMLLTAFALQLFFPPNPVVFAVQAALLALFIAGNRHKEGILSFNFFQTRVHNARQLLSRDSNYRWPLYLTSGLILLGLGFAGWYAVRFYRAAQHSLLAVKALSTNDVVGVYDNQQLARNLNPYYDLYRRDYALTSLNIAEALANRTDKKPEDESTIAQLIQQAVAEAQAAVVLDGRDANNSLLAALIYQRLVGGVEGADSFAVQYFTQAANLYPSSPDVYIALAGIYIQKQDWNTAVNVLARAVQVKPDHANALFNLAYVLEQAGALPDALTYYTQTRAQVTDTESEDYKTLTTKIDELTPKVEEILKAQAAQQQQQSGLDAAQSATPSAVDLNLNQGGNINATPENQPSLGDLVQENNAAEENAETQPTDESQLTTPAP